MEDALKYFMGASITGGVAILIAWVKGFLTKRVKVSSPESRQINKIMAIVENQSSILGFLLTCNAVLIQSSTATLEALKGQCNGNVDQALRDINKTKASFDQFLIQQATRGGTPDDASAQG